MALMTWSNSYSVGVKAMDEQHKRLVGALNSLHTAMLSGQAKAATGELLAVLMKYTEEHFAAEETMMRRTGYPEFEKHRAKHAELTSQVKKYAERFQRGETSLNVDLLTFLRDWLTRHVLQTDRDYGPWLNAHGVN